VTLVEGDVALVGEGDGGDSHTRPWWDGQGHFLFEDEIPPFRELEAEGELLVHPHFPLEARPLGLGHAGLGSG
jgi:hypothetical protein